MHLEVADEMFNLCSWTCLIGFAAIKAHNTEAALVESLRAKEIEISNLERWLAIHQADIL